ncbi:MAG: membrane protein [Candidatus Entotheonella factor]|uniref:Probable membrane transporter protein n=1 Tax=Entotheonella factor TaxID=1429438 RepID=W4L3D5_ENTF1|nr:MAG: membrane protein [Candidatus Entotheonella factor]
MTVLSLFFGALVGFSLGLTGGGGSIFAVPLLVYGLSVAPREAIGISLAAVGATALIGGLQRVLAGEVDLRTGVLFALAGMLGAPMGAWLNADIPESLLLGMFAGLMVFVATRMWGKTSLTNQVAHASAQTVEGGESHTGLRGMLLLISIGLLAGVLSGMFGVGGGFVIVPALVLVSGMAIHRAVATSLIVIALVSVSGGMSYMLAGRPIELSLAGLFVLGGVAGMGAGTQLSRKLSGPVLQKGFAFAIGLVAVFMIVKSVV